MFPGRHPSFFYTKYFYLNKIAGSGRREEGDFKGFRTTDDDGSTLHTVVIYDNTSLLFVSADVCLE